MTEKNNLTIDLGTGAGLPGILLSIIGYKNLHLVEKSPKKSAFLENCKLRLGLDCTIHNQPLAEISLSNARYIVARAFAPISKILNFTRVFGLSRRRHPKTSNEMPCFVQNSALACISAHVLALASFGPPKSDDSIAFSRIRTLCCCCVPWFSKNHASRMHFKPFPASSWF